MEKILERMVLIAKFVPPREGWTIAAKTNGRIIVWAPADLCRKPKAP